MPRRRAILGIIRHGRLARLMDDFTWQMRGPGDLLDRGRLAILRQDFDRSNYGPAHGEPGHKLLFDATEAPLEGRAVWLAPQGPPLPPGAVY
jgi:hypothetical protein